MCKYYKRLIDMHGGPVDVDPSSYNNELYIDCILFTGGLTYKT